MNKEKVERIRKRKSYRMWKDLIEFLKKNPSRREIMEYIYSVMDAKMAFGFQHLSNYAYESLQQLLKDEGLGTCVRDGNN